MAEVTGSPSRHQISYVRVVTAGWKRKSIHVKNCTGATALSRRPLAIEDVDPSCIATGRRLCSSDPEIPKLSEEDQEKEFRWPELEDQNVANYWTGTAAGRESPRIGLHSICLRNFGYEIMPATSSHFLGKCLDGRCMSVMLTGHFIRGNGNADAVVHILSQLKA
jgi:hypothetical protein